VYGLLLVVVNHNARRSSSTVVFALLVGCTGKAGLAAVAGGGRYGPLLYTSVYVCVQNEISLATTAETAAAVIHPVTHQDAWHSGWVPSRHWRGTTCCLHAACYSAALAAACISVGACLQYSTAVGALAPGW
jgi:hypothetical protein